MKVVDFESPVTNAWLALEGHRLDAPPFLSGAVEAKVRLEKLHAPKQPLKDVTLKLLNPGRISRTWVTDARFGVPFLRSTDILTTDLSSLPMISKKNIGTSDRFLLKEGWTLITRSGTIGRMAYSRPEMAGMACSEDVLRVIPDPATILPGYLYAYLSSRYGKALVTSGTYGAIIQHIEPEHIADLPVPRFGSEFEGRVHELVHEAGELTSDFQNHLKEATAQFFSAVGMGDIDAAEWHGQGPDYGFSATATQMTMRAANFNPRFHRLAEKLRRVPHLTLGKACKPGTLRRGERFKRVEAEPEHAYRLVGQRELFYLEPEGRWIAQSVLGPGSLGRDGMILTAAQGTLGENEVYCRSEFVWSTGSEMAYSEHLLRIIADEEKILPGCLFAFIRSETAFRMLRSISVGSKLQDHHYALLPELPVPLPTREAQEQIHDLVTQAYMKRWRGVALENEARRLVEQAIESDSQG